MGQRGQVQLWGLHSPRVGFGFKCHSSDFMPDFNLLRSSSSSLTEFHTKLLTVDLAVSSAKSMDMRWTINLSHFCISQGALEEATQHQQRHQRLKRARAIHLSPGDAEHQNK